ncbi:mitotic spindle assembly checkpoint protein MAD1 isoform X1 [Anguilla anguilla]|uniref:mitotic spindle assembly checkpoint protein MAD1 isoform X1 n=1 Tax=Anguilla anguilla TaxID=7936 RepID=UPI0015A81125|nr:mitotic spindle assembly checkpoint protein MAD1 isoform X1 [Anguilla anguilla]XP_035261026.1 mitotic spindle assembly checkpoint protein MAD1 isoform X1 [Anguilla anguilla]
MDGMDDDTTVFTTLKSFKSFISQPETSQHLAETSIAKGDLQRQYIQRIELEGAAEKIHSKTNLLQMAQEKKQMELSHKRARIELEKAAHISARDFEREVDRNQDLHTRIKKIEEKAAQAEKVLAEQTEMNKTLKKSIEAQNKRLEEKDSKISNANETLCALRDEIRELNHRIKNQEMQLTAQATENEGLQEQVQLQHKKYLEASQKYQALQTSECLNSENELKIKELERRLALQEQDSVIVRNMRAELARVPDMERELKRLREENGYLRETRENSSLLKEEAEGLRRKVERLEKMKEDMVSLELEKEKLATKLQAWENLSQTTGLNIRKPEDLSREIIQIQQREIDLKQQNSSITSSARALEKARAQLQDELLQLRSKVLEEQKKREQQDGLVRRLQKRVLLLTKERDGMRAILESYDNELAASEYSPQLTRRVREAEDLLQKAQAHSSEMEAQLYKAQEEAGSYKLQAQTAEMELDVLKKQASSAENSSFVVGEEVNSLRQKIEELEAERSRLEEQNNALEMRLERHNLQGDYDPLKTKVIHFRMNPTSLAKQERQDEAEQLREECRRLREHVRTLQAGGAVAAEEGALNLPPSQEVLDLRKQMESAELKNQRLKEVFQKKIQEFRTVCYVLTGYQIDITTENQYRLTSVYAEHMDDSLLFKASGPAGGNMQLLETDFSRTLRELVDLHLFHQNSIPAFLSAVTLDLFSRQTMA